MYGLSIPNIGTWYSLLPTKFLHNVGWAKEEPSFLKQGQLSIRTASGHSEVFVLSAGVYNGRTSQGDGHRSLGVQEYGD